MKKINLNKYPIIDKWFEFPVLGWGFKTIKCVEWKNGVRTEVYIDIKTRLKCTDFILKLLAGKNAPGFIRIESSTEIRRGMNQKERNIEFARKILISDTYIDPLDEYLEDIFDKNSKILFMNFNLKDDPKMIYYLLESIDIKLSLSHKTIKYDVLKTLGDNEKEILNTLKNLSDIQKEIGRINNINELIKYKNIKIKSS